MELNMINLFVGHPKRHPSYRTSPGGAALGA